MLLTGVAIAGGALVTGSVKVYRENKSMSRGTREKKETPWTVAAERLVLTKKGMAKKQGNHRLAMSSYRKKGTVLENGFMAKGKAVLNHIKEQQLALFPSDPRQQQLLEISNGTEESESSEVEKKMNHYFAVSLTSLGLATAGALFYSPFTLLTIPALAYAESYRIVTLISDEEGAKIGV